MNDFDAKWQVCAASARENPRRDEEAPLGFATRVLAAAAQSRTPNPSLEQVWQRLTWSSLGLMGTVLIICALLELPHMRDRKPLEPGIENTVAQLVWAL